jgi:D-alanyl-lipoteichoic acid acyltransferase DltB (MBOAT superfamily)
MATWLILWGFYLKIFVADNLAFAVNDVYSSGGSKNPLEIILGTYAFAFQIFGDFAGYSSIAIGIARLMGFKLMTNFLFPYFVTNSQDFWRNWHISLSSWLRDYLYISLGGSRHGPRQTYRNLFLTMFLGGIWHGAAWPYFIWGTFQGCALIIHRLFESGASQFRKTSAASSDSFLFLRIFLMFQITCIGWLVFRANSLEQIETMSHSLVFGEYQPTTKSTALLKQIIFFAAPLMLIQFYNWKHNNQFAVLDLNNAKKILLSLFLIYSIVFWGEFGAQQFIYFQF